MLEVNALETEEEMVDVLLCPAGPGCAPLLDQARRWRYTSQWNLLDYPAVVFPTGLKCELRYGAEEGYVPGNEEDRRSWEGCEFSCLSPPFFFSLTLNCFPLFPSARLGFRG